MAIHEFHLIGPEADEEFQPVQHIHAGDVSQSKTGWNVTRRRLNSGLSAGVEVVEVDNGRAKFVLLPTRGMSLWKAFAGEDVLGWQSPVRGPVHPSLVPISEPSGFGWLMGFDELMCRCGLVSNGAPEFDEQGRLLYPIHGRIANLPAHEVMVEVDDSAGTIRVRGVVEETRFHFEKLRLQVEYVTSFESTAIDWHDRVTNFGGTSVDVQMLYHTNIGAPLLGAGSKLVAPVLAVTPWEGNPAEVSPDSWPDYQGPQAGRAQECYYLDLEADAAGNTQVTLEAAESDASVTLRFNKQQLPCFTQWKNEVAMEDGYVTGLEPALNYPHVRSREVEAGRCQRLDGGETWEASLSLEWHPASSG
ncbi:MAG: DUF4432 family protein [Planctomycetota bacterium]